MKEQLEHRLKEPKSEFESGQKMLAESDARQANLMGSLLRIGGAIQALKRNRRDRDATSALKGRLRISTKLYS